MPFSCGGLLPMPDGWLLNGCRRMAAHRGVTIAVEEPHVEGAWVGSGDVLCYLRGSFAALVDLDDIPAASGGCLCVGLQRLQHVR